MKNGIILFVFVLLGFCIRVLGIHWDQGTFLHPDERFLVMVTQELSFPDSLHQYFSKESPLRVENTKHSFYVYGTFPVVLLKGLSHFFLKEVSFYSLTMLGRYISLFLETATIFGVYFLAQYFTQKQKLPVKTPFWASLIYACMVLPIQLSHFFAVDPFVTFFALLAFLLFTLSERKKSLFWVALGSISWGLALSSKISAVFFAPLFMAFFLSLSFSTYQNSTVFPQPLLLWRRRLLNLSKYLFVLGLFTYITVRTFNPEYFSSLSWLNPLPSPHLLKNLHSLKEWTQPHTWFPPSIQWLERTPFIFSFINLVFFGIGVWQAIALLAGILFIFFRHTKSFLNITALWAVGYFSWQSVQFVQSLRYFYFLYPFFAVFAAIALSSLQKKLNHKKPFAVSILFVIFILFWPLMFLQIFFSPHTRVQATYWMRENIPAQSSILYEYWDDALPLSYIPGEQPHYTITPIPVFDQDSPQKWGKIQPLFQSADYYTLTSNRAWASISRLPKRYPETSRFYSDLFAEKTPYQLVKVFQSSPSLEWLGIPLTLDDTWSEEAFTVYDHPTVYIFKNQKN